MKRIVTVLALGAGLLLAAGCGSQAATGSGSGSAVLSTPTSHVVVPGAGLKPGGLAVPGGRVPPGAVPVPDSKVDASTLPRYYPHHVWTEDNGTVLVLDAEEGGCTSSTVRVLQQTGTQVTLLLQPTSTMGAQARACPMYLTYKPVMVTLAAPLGSRTVVLKLER